MSRTEAKQSLLLTQFRGFYDELIRLKRLLKSGMVAGKSGSPEMSPEQRVAVQVSERLTAVMEQQALIAGRRGSDYTGMYRQAEYVMAALADELLLHQIEWPGKHAWNDHLMEYRLFGTRVSGDEFFRRLERVLQTPDPLYKDLATVYLMAIVLGFRGRYFGGADQGAIDSYRQRLFTFIFHGNPELKKETKKLFPDAYLHTVEEGAMRPRLPAVRIWYVLLVVLIGIYVLISRWVWIGATGEVEATKDRIERLSQ